MAQKILRIGTSVGVTIPKDMLEELNLKVGDTVVLESDPKTRTFTVGLRDSVKDETIDWARKFMKKYDKALTELAK